MSMNRTPRGRNLSHVQETNRSLILKLILEQGLVNRTDLSRMTGLTPSTVSNIVNHLLNNGVLVSDGFEGSGVGRRTENLRYNPSSPICLGMRLARNYIRIASFSMDGVLRSSDHVEVSDMWHVDDVIESMTSLYQKFVTSPEIEEKTILGLGIAAPGPLVAETGRVVMISNFPGWRDVSLSEIFEEYTNLPTIVEHDANAAVVAEKYFGGHRDNTNMAYVAAGRGIGAGLLVDGTLYRGTYESTGEIGHMSIDYNGPSCECGNRGCLELFCSSRTLLHQAKKEISPEISSVKDIEDAATTGDERARDLLKRNGDFLGIGIVNLINSMGPSTVIIGDELIDAGDYWFNNLSKTVKSRVLPGVWDNVQIKRSALPDDPVLLGVGIMVLERLFADPSTLFALDQQGV